MRPNRHIFSIANFVSVHQNEPRHISKPSTSDTSSAHWHSCIWNYVAALALRMPRAVLVVPAMLAVLLLHEADVALVLPVVLPVLAARRLLPLTVIIASARGASGPDTAASTPTVCCCAAAAATAAAAADAHHTTITTATTATTTTTLIYHSCAYYGFSAHGGAVPG